MTLAQTLSRTVGVKRSCAHLGIPRATYYRDKKISQPTTKARSSRPALALSHAERESVLSLLHSERFVDKTPYEIYATLLDEGHYYCSIRTMYRYLSQAQEVQERRKGHRIGHYRKPELIATKTNEVWSWDITKLRGPVKWSYYYLYVIIDIYSRYVVGWMVAHQESAVLSSALIEQTCERQGIKREQLTLHADRGSSMKSKTVSQLLSDLCVMKSHSRPRVSNDNPFSESQFKTLKYSPEYPERFGCIEDARDYCRRFFEWYNHEHKHTGIALLTPDTVHYGREKAVLTHRQQILLKAYEANPERFKGKKPVPQALPEAVYINKPQTGDVNAA